MPLFLMPLQDTKCGKYERGDSPATSLFLEAWCAGSDKPCEIGGRKNTGERVGKEFVKQSLQRQQQSNKDAWEKRRGGDERMDTMVFL